MRICQLGILALPFLLTGCIGPVASKDTNTPAYLYPKTGFPVPLDAPSPAETNGVLFRYKPHYGDTVKYRYETITFAENEAVTRQGLIGRQYVITLDEQRKCLPSGKENVFDFDSLYVYPKTSQDGGPGKLSIDDRGRFRYRPLEVNNAVISYKYSRCDPLFTDQAVSIGDLWDQRVEYESEIKAAKHVSTTLISSGIKWRLSGFATIGTHRCAVLEGLVEETTSTWFDGNVADKIAFLSRKRVVHYFDYQLGIDVRTITFATKVSTYKRRAEEDSQVVVSLVE